MKQKLSKKLSRRCLRKLTPAMMMDSLKLSAILIWRPSEDAQL